MNAPRKTMRKPRRNFQLQKGQAIVIVALGMIALLAFLVLAIDGSKYYDQRRVSQNASDVASLAGLYTYYNVTGGNNNCATIAKIIQVAEANGVPDTDNVASDGKCTGNLVNANVSAYWINTSGDYVTSPHTSMSCTTGTVSRDSAPPACASIDTSTTYGAPTGNATAANNAAGIKVRVLLPYTTFIGHLIGQKQLQAQADGIALQSITGKKYPDDQTKQAVWSGGGAQCNDGTNPVLSIGMGGNNSAQNTDISNAMINGGLAGGSTNDVNKQYQGTLTLVGTSNGSPSTSNPLNMFGSSSNGFVQGSTYAPAYPFPDWAYYTDSVQNVNHQLKQAIFFQPDATDSTVDTPTSPVALSGAPAGAGAVPAFDASVNNYIFKYHERKRPQSPANFYHYIKYSTAADNGNGLVAMIKAGKGGIFYVDGNLTLSGNLPNFPTYSNYNTAAGYGTTIIVNGTVFFDSVNNWSIGNAGPWGHGISILAGGYPTAGQSPCAKNPADAMMTFDAQQDDWNGIIYVPNGLFSIGGNFNNSGITHGTVVAYSIGIGMAGHPAQNAAFGPCPSCFMEPTTAIGLNQ